jgi:hypothetical protein
MLTRRATFVYIDEAQDYFDEGIENLLKPRGCRPARRPFRQTSNRDPKPPQGWSHDDMSPQPKVE